MPGRWSVVLALATAAAPASALATIPPPPLTPEPHFTQGTQNAARWNRVSFPAGSIGKGYVLRVLDVTSGATASLRPRRDHEHRRLQSTARRRSDHGLHMGNATNAIWPPPLTVAVPYGLIPGPDGPRTARVALGDGAASNGIIDIPDSLAIGNRSAEIATTVTLDTFAPAVTLVVGAQPAVAGQR